MLEEPIKIEKREAIIYSPLPEDIYTVELLDINSEERATYDTRNNPKMEQIMEKVLMFQFTLLEGLDKKEGKDLRGRNLWENFVPAYLYEGRKGKNKLYQIIEALLGHDLTQEEEATLDQDMMNKLIGSQCRVINKQVKKDDKIWDRIVQYLPVDDEKESLNNEEKELARVKVKDEMVKDETVKEEVEEVKWQE